MEQDNTFFHGSVIGGLDVILANAKSHVNGNSVAYFTTDRVYALAPVAEKYRAGEISKEEYDKWRYNYPQYGDTQIWAKVPSQEFSDAMVKAFKDRLKDKSMEDNEFWERSWKSLDQEKLSLYIENFDDSADLMIDSLLKHGCNSLCDAGCGCGVYALKLAKHGFSVSGFDISGDAVKQAKHILSENGYPTQGFRCADVLSTGYTDGCFDAVVARDVLDHMPIQDGAAAVEEMLRIVRPGGCVLMTLDGTDEEYESEPHTVNSDGDYLYSGGKWNGMVFHPYSPEEIDRLLNRNKPTLLEAEKSGFLVVLKKGEL